MVDPIQYSGSEMDPDKWQREMDRCLGRASKLGKLQSENDIVVPTDSDIESIAGIQAEDGDKQDNIKGGTNKPRLITRQERQQYQKSVTSKIRGARTKPKSESSTVIVDATTGRQVTAQSKDVPSNYGSAPIDPSVTQEGQPSGHGGHDQEDLKDGSPDARDTEGKPILTKIKDPQTNKPVEVVTKPELTLDKYVTQTKEANFDDITSELDKLEQQMLQLQQIKMAQIRKRVDQICDFIDKLNNSDELGRIYNAVSNKYKVIASKDKENG